MNVLWQKRVLGKTKTELFFKEKLRYDKNMKKVDFLKRKYHKFIYQKYSYIISKNNLEILFDFKIQPDIQFRPKVVIKNIDKKQKTEESVLNNLVFNLGLIEMVSYWKTTCSPVIEIKCDNLNKEQIGFWQDLIMKGMGQFFFENKMPFQKPKFVNAEAKPPSILNEGGLASFSVKERYLVPVGGGKDSPVTLESLKKQKKEIRCFGLNPTDSAEKIIKIAGFKNPIIVERKIDKKLLGLNQKGFLNGHTPFSAYLAFLATLTGVLFDYKYIALSNEKSASEGNIKYLGRVINHQWSKSFEFEKKFRKYSKKYLAKNIEYFSFLRSLSEIQIAKLFSKYPKYFPVFLSCNEAYKTVSGTKKPAKKWCGKCSKCLFVFTVLYPFIEEKKLIRIFGKNLFEDKSLLPVMEQLTGRRGFKPFECVGTKKESKLAFELSLKKALRQAQGKPLPYLLKKLNN